MGQLVFGLWSLVFRFWFLGSGLCALLFAVRCLLFAVCWTKQNPPPAFVGSGLLENRFCALRFVSAGTRSPARHRGGDANEHRGRDLF